MGMFSGAAGALGGLGLSEGIFDWANVFTGGDRPGPSTSKDPAQVYLHERAADLPGGGLMDQLGFRHWWLRTPNREAGMGPETGGVPGERFELPGMTTINDHTGQAADTTGTDIHTTPVPGVDPARVDELLQLGRPTGPWLPFLNDCNSTMDDVLEDAGASTRDRPLLSPMHSRSLHDVISGRAGDGQTATTGILGALGGIGGMVSPGFGLGMLGAGAAGYLSGTTASWLEDQGRTTEAEAVSILGMGASGASIGAGIGGLAGAGIGGALGLIGGSAMSLFGDESSTSSRVQVPGLGTSISAEEGVGIGGMAAGGALLGTMICPGVGTLIGGGIGGLVGLGASLWD